MKKNISLLLLLLLSSSIWSQSNLLNDYSVRMVNPISMDVIQTDKKEIKFKLKRIDQKYIQNDSVINNSVFYNDSGYKSIILDKNRKRLQENKMDSLFILAISSSSKKVDSLITNGYKISIIDNINIKSKIIFMIDEIQKNELDSLYTKKTFNELSTIKNVIINQFTPISKDKLLLLESVTNRYNNLLSINSNSNNGKEFKVLNRSISSMANNFIEVKGDNLVESYLTAYTKVLVKVMDKEGNHIKNTRIYYAFEADAYLKNTNRYMNFPTLCSPCDFKVESLLPYQFWAANDDDLKPLTQQISIKINSDKIISIELILK
jgi:hypothetical protein